MGPPKTAKSEDKNLLTACSAKKSQRYATLFNHPVYYYFFRRRRTSIAQIRNHGMIFCQLFVLSCISFAFFCATFVPNLCSKMGSQLKVGSQSGPRNGAAVNESFHGDPVFGSTFWPHFWVLVCNPIFGTLAFGFKFVAQSRIQNLKRLALVFRAASKTASLKSSFSCPSLKIVA